MKNSWLAPNELFISALLRKYTLGGGRRRGSVLPKFKNITWRPNETVNRDDAGVVEGLPRRLARLASSRRVVAGGCKAQFEQGTHRDSTRVAVLAGRLACAATYHRLP